MTSRIPRRGDRSTCPVPPPSPCAAGRNHARTCAPSSSAILQKLRRRRADGPAKAATVAAGPGLPPGESPARKQAGFAEARDGRRRLEEKLDEHGKQVARLQGIVERTYEPHRFTVGMPGKPPAAAHGAPGAPDEPPADLAAVGSR